MPILTSQEYKVTIDEPFTYLNQFVSDLNPSKVIVLVDDNTSRFCLPIFTKYFSLPFLVIKILEGEQYKNLETCQYIWQELLAENIDRHAVMINLGGGVIGDMGGFAASTYKRGIKFIQMPTTLLSQVDASVGGKLGIDFLSQKNMIGLFKNPILVFIHTEFLNSLNPREIKSGFSEIIKHGLIQSKSLWQKIIDSNNISENTDFLALITESIQLKNLIVTEDPYENGIRKILNFGHTIGHAVESLYLKNDYDIRHGEAIAAGMICEAYISCQLDKLHQAELDTITDFISRNYPYLNHIKGAEEAILDFCRKDKKNKAHKMLFTLINEIGEASYDQEVEEEMVLESLRYYQNLYN